MSFLTPLFFLGALAVIGPLIFHLIKRSTRERNIFSAILFLRQTPPRLNRRSRLEDILLLILRCLALALLAFGFSRPFIRDTAPPPPVAAQSRQVVVLVDRSASMQRQGLWAEAREQVSDLVDAADPGDQFAVYLFGRQPETLLSFEEWTEAPVSARAGLATGRMATADPGWESTDLGAALVTAADDLTDTSGAGEGASVRQIVLISDLQAGSQLEQLQSYDWPTGIQLVLKPLRTENPTNAGLQLLAEAPDATEGNENAVRVRVANSTDSGRENFQVGWTRPENAGFVGPAVDVYVPPGQSRVIAVPVPENTSGLRQVSLRGDDEDFDNTVHVVPPEQQVVAVAYLGSEAISDIRQPLFFLDKALTALGHARLSFDLTAAAPEAMPVAALDQARVIFASELPGEAGIAALRAQLEAGKTVIFAPKSTSAAAGLGQLVGASPVALTDVVTGSGARTGNQYGMFGRIEFGHPLFAPFADPRFSDFTKIHIWKYRRVEPESLPGSRVLAAYDRGDPAIIEVPVASGRVLVLLNGWNTEDSDLAVSSRFIPLMYSFLDLGGAIPPQAVDFRVSDALPRSLLGSEEGGVTVTLPNGTTQALADDATAFAGTTQPGIYEVRSGNRLARVSVNIDGAESRTEPMAADLLERYGAPGPEPVVDQARQARRAALMQGAEAEGQQKLWRWFIIGTLAMLLVESVFAGWTARQNSARVEEGAKTS